MTEQAAVDHVIRALHAVEIVRDQHASGPQSVPRILEICDNLVVRDTKMGKFGGLRRNVADAICKAYFQRTYEEMKSNPAS